MLDPIDLQNFALCVWKEARGQGAIGMRAVAHVIINRVGEEGFPTTLHDVIYQKNAFTSMSVPTDPEYNLVPVSDDPQYNYCLTMCDTIELPSNPDPTFGAHYYANLSEVTSGWFVDVISGPDGQGAPNHPFTAKIGSQSFFI